MNQYLQAFVICFIFSLGLTSCHLGGKKEKIEITEVEVPSDEEKISAVKEILKLGVNSALDQLSAESGFFNSDSLEAIFPKNTHFALDQIKKLMQGADVVDSTIIQVNQIAKSSVTIIGPILNTAIDSMTVDEINSILLSDSATATGYLEKVIRKPLHIACEPIILQSLDQALIGENTTRNTWKTFAGNYNKIAESGIGRVARMNSLEIVLDEFVTDQILDAVFFLIAKEEMSIRKHPATRISQSLAKTLGWVETK